jgi:hypothetical protein
VSGDPYSVYAPGLVRGRYQALEIEFLKGALKNAPRPRSATTSVIAGPTASPSQKDAG